MLALPLALGLVLAPSHLSAQRYARRHSEGDWLENRRQRRWHEDRARYCEERESGWRWSAGQLLRVDAHPNGGVRVSGWDTDSVNVVARIQSQADDEDEARDVAGRIRVEASGGVLRATGPASRHGASWSVSYEIMVPSRTDLDLGTLNGPLAVEDVAGRMQLSATNGPLSLRALAGDVRAHAQNGPLTVELEGSRWEGAGLDAETQNGPLVLSIPEGYNAQLETGTVNGPMSFDFPITLQGRIGGRRITTTLGSGGPTIRAVTTNGPAVIRRGGARGL